MARLLFKSIFTVEELKTHSLSGKRCPALGEDQIILPALDPIRKNAILSNIQRFLFWFSAYYQYWILFLDFVLRHAGYGEKSGATDASGITYRKDKSFQKDLKRSIADLLREQRKKKAPKTN